MDANKQKDRHFTFQGAAGALSSMEWQTDPFYWRFRYPGVDRAWHKL